MSNRCPPPRCEHLGAYEGKLHIGFFAAFHRSFLCERLPWLRAVLSVSCIRLNTGGLRGLRRTATMLVFYALGPCLQTRATNSSRPGYYLRDARQGFAFARRGEDRGQGLGSDPFGKRHPLASRGGRRRETPDSGAVCLLAAKTPGKRRRENRRVSRELREARLGTAATRKVRCPAIEKTGQDEQKEKRQVQLEGIASLR